MSQNLIAAALKATPGASNAKIARDLEVSKEAVRKWRAKLKMPPTPRGRTGMQPLIVSITMRIGSAVEVWKCDFTTKEKQAEFARAAIATIEQGGTVAMRRGR